MKNNFFCLLYRKISQVVGAANTGKMKRKLIKFKLRLIEMALISVVRGGVVHHVSSFENWRLEITLHLFTVFLP